MSRLSRFLCIRCACWFFMALAGFSAPALASDAPKPPPPEEKKPNYANEKGQTGRDGSVHKRILKDQGDEPKPLPKEEWQSKEVKKKEAPVKYDEKGQPIEDKNGGSTKDKKKDDGHGEPVKEEQKKNAGKDDGHAASKKVESTVSELYDPEVIKLDVNNRPHTPVIQSNSQADYFLCNKTVSNKYQEIIINEINTFADRMGLPRAQPIPCMVKISKPGTKFPGAIFVEFYVDEKAASSCIRLNNCISTRLVMLYPKNKKAKSVQEIYRSYVLTDERKYKRSSFCVSPEGQLLGDKNCYVALHPDWLFN